MDSACSEVKFANKLKRLTACQAKEEKRKKELFRLLCKFPSRNDEA